jgi:hypothetical protein
MIRELTQKLAKLLPYYDDTPKEVDTRTPDGKTKRVRVNTPSQIAPDGFPEFGPADLKLDPLQRHTITIAAGPAFDSQQAEGKDAAMALLNNPQAFPIVAADAVRLMNLGPIGEEMAKDLEYLQPPAMRAEKQAQAGPGAPPDPRALQQQVAQLKEQIQHAEAAMQQLEQEAKGKQLDNQSKESIADMETQRRAILEIKLQTMKDATAIAVAKINALTKGVIADNENQIEQIALDHEAAITLIGQQHEAEQAGLDRGHQAALAIAQTGAAQAHAAGMAAAGIGAAADEADKGRQAALEAQGGEGGEGEPTPAGAVPSTAGSAPTDAAPPGM